MSEYSKVGLGGPRESIPVDERKETDLPEGTAPGRYYDTTIEADMKKYSGKFKERLTAVAKKVINIMAITGVTKSTIIKYLGKLVPSFKSAAAVKFRKGLISEINKLFLEKGLTWRQFADALSDELDKNVPKDYIWAYKQNGDAYLVKKTHTQYVAVVIAWHAFNPANIINRVLIQKVNDMGGKFLIKDEKADPATYLAYSVDLFKKARKDFAGLLNVMMSLIHNTAGKGGIRAIDVTPLIKGDQDEAREVDVYGWSYDVGDVPNLINPQFPNVLKLVSNKTKWKIPETRKGAKRITK